jgi:diketogulonate reductase-like aldo/keto reductase
MSAQITNLLGRIAELKAANEELRAKAIPATAIPAFPLSNGETMPAVGLGTWGGGDDAQRVAGAVKTAVENGYTMIDCAECYGNEKEVGDILKEVVGTTISRDQLFVTSKCWNTNHKPEHVRQACLNSLKNLGLGYLDLYLVHWPVAWEHTGVDLKPARPTDEGGGAKMAKVPLIETWKAMEALVDDGLVSTSAAQIIPLSSRKPAICRSNRLVCPTTAFFC